MGLPSWAVRIYISLLTALAVGAFLFSVLSVGNVIYLWIATAIISLAIAFLDYLPIDLYNDQVEITISDSVKFAAVLLYPVPVVVVSTFIGTIIGEIPAQRTWVKKVFNISEMTLTWAIVAGVFRVLHQPEIDYFSSTQNVLALGLAGFAGLVASSVFVPLVISLTEKQSFRYTWMQNVRQLILTDFSVVILGVYLAILWQYNPWSVILGILPLFVIRHSYKTAYDLERQAHDVLYGLVRVIDERDHHISGHSDQVAEHAHLIAEALGMSQDELEVIDLGAQLHDLGKVGMADDILFSPRLLNHVERKSAEQHAEIGATLLSKFRLFDKAAILVRHHHEHYDGGGYPGELMGERIPIGSRIIAVADAFQAMTEDRPYRRALSQEEAIAELLAGSGTQFDPKIVQTFVEILEGAKSQNQPTPVSLSKNMKVTSDAS